MQNNEECIWKTKHTPVEYAFPLLFAASFGPPTSYLQPHQ